MTIFLEAVCIILLLVVFYQDMKLRAIHIGLPFLIAGLGVFFFFKSGYHVGVLWSNILFLFVTCVGLYIYLSVKSRALVNPFKSIGKGDFLFFLAVIPYFSTANYILYFITGMLFSIFTFLAIKAVSKTDLVPLAGLLALYMVILKCITYVTDLDFFETNFI